jgi:CRISPR/Cas system-associated exonuclease Cas4 (RecB family)
MNSLYQIVRPAEGACEPACYSHTGLAQIENCPRRWWLLHSKYDELMGWYPEPVSSGAMVGSIVHAALEHFSMEFAQSRMREGSSGIKEFRRRFPIREFVRQTRKRLLDEARANPRAQLAMLETNVSVDGCISLFKDLVRQSYGKPALESAVVLQNDLREAKSPAESGKKGLVGQSRRKDVPFPAILPEVELRLDDPPVRGKIDLVVTAIDGDTLIEYKTGERRPEHEKQSQLYAFLWWATTGRLARERQLLYPNQNVVKLGGMTQSGLQQEEKALKARVAWAKKEIASKLPGAHIEEQRCRSCTVRQLCEEYWTAKETAASRWVWNGANQAMPAMGSIEWRDLEMELARTERLAEGFMVRGQTEKGTKQIVCKMPPQFRASTTSSYKRVRLLNVGLVPDGEVTRVIWSSASEAFWG